MKNKLLVFLFLLISIKVQAQCTLDGNITASSTTLCSGIAVDLIAGPTGGVKPYRYTWSTGETTDTISVNKAGTYSVTVTDQAGCQTIRSIDIATNAVPNPPTAAGGLACPNSSTTLTATAPGGLYQWFDAPVGGNFLGSGDNFTTPPITAKAIFYVQTTIAGCTSSRTAVTVFPIAGPSVSGAPTCPGSSVTFTADGAGSYQWYDSPTGGTVLGTGKTFTTPALFSTTNYYVVGTTAGCTSLPTTATATILPTPPAPETTASVTVCSGSVINLHVTNVLPNTIYDWFDSPSGGTSIISSPDYTTPVLNATATYYVQATVNNCVGARTPVTITIDPIPTAPVIQPVTGCSGSAVTVVAPTANGVYNWYATPSSTTILASGNNFTTPVLNTPTTFYVELMNGNCVSPRVPVSISINPTPTAPTVSPTTPVCTGDISTLTAIGPGGTYDWFSQPTGGTSVFTGAAFNTPPLTANTTYYVQTTSAEGCISQRTAVTVLVTATPTTPTVSGVTNICPGTGTTLTAVGNATTYQWYDAPTGGNMLTASPTFTTSPSTTTTYYVQAVSNSCSSPRAAVTVTVEPVPPLPTAGSAPAPICAGNTVTLTASTAGGTVQWFDAAVGGNLLSSGDAYTTPVLSVTTTYYAGATNGACVSARIPVTVAIINTDDQFRYSSGTFCTSSADQTPTITLPGGSFSATPAGLVINSSTGKIDIAASALGTYSVKYVGSCATQTQNISIVTTPNASFTYNAPRYCQNLPNVVPVFSTGATGGTFSASPAGLIFVNASTGQIDLAASKPGTYLVTNTINSSGGCPSVTSAPVKVIIDGSVFVFAGDVQSIPLNTSVQLAGKISGAVTKGTWSGGTGTFSDKNDLNAIYTPGPGETSITLKLTSDDPGNSCGPASDNVHIGFGSKPASPTVSVSPVCPGSQANLVAIAPGGKYEWYNAAVGGVLLYSGSTFTTPPLTSSTTYYVQAIVSNIISDRVAVNVTVLPAAPTPTVGPAPAPMCPGTKATLNATVSSGTVQWFDTSGVLLNTGNTYTTKALNTTTTFYVGASNGTCTGTLTPITVQVISLADQFSFASGTYCKTAVDPVPTIKVAGGTFSATPAGLAINSSTGKIDLAASALGNYRINYTNVCGITTARLSLVVTPDANFTYSASSYCQNTANVSPVFSAGASAGTFSATPSGLSFINASSGQIDLSTSLPGTYSIINTINGNGGCATVVSKIVSVTINPAVIISAGDDQVLAVGTPVKLAGSIGGGASAGTWSGGAGTFSNTTALNAIYTPAPGETSVTLTLTSADPGNTCGPASKTVTITFKPKPAAPTVSPMPVCSGGVATLTATAPGGGIYTWFDTPTGGGSIGTGVNFVTPPLTTTTIYYVQTTIGGLASDRTAVTVAVSSTPAAPTAVGMPICSGTQALLIASGSTGSYEWYDAQTGGNLLFTGASFNTPFLTTNTSYYVQTTVGICTSTRTKVDVTIKPLPNVISGGAIEPICSGNTFNYAIIADLPGTSFRWSRVANTEISDPAVTGQTTNVINEPLTSTVGTPVKVVYKITPILNECEGVPFDLIVTVLPVAKIISDPPPPVCSGSSLGYSVQFSTDVQLSWSRAEVPGIINKAIDGQQSRTIYEYLQNNTNAPIDVFYVFTYSTGNCTGSTFTLKVTVNPKVNITPGGPGEACSGIPQGYQITSDVPTAEFIWSRDKIPGIDNPAEPGKISGVIDEALVNKTGADITVDYHINTIKNGCQTADFIYPVTVHPEIQTPEARGNSPVCTGNTIQLDTDPFPQGTYQWEGPNGFSSTLRNPTITASTGTAGIYKLYLVANGCTSVAGEIEVKVTELPIVNAGQDRIVCKADPYIQLEGNISGGTTTGVWTGGNGRFEPGRDVPNAKYYPTDDERQQNNSITFTLHSTSLANCAPVSDDVTYTFGLIPAANAGTDQQVCIVAGAVSLDGTILIPGDGVWSIKEGTGTFNPTTGLQKNGQPSPQYIPSTEDIKNGKVTLVLTAINYSPECNIPSDDVTLSFLPPPIISAGPTKYLLKGNTTTLTPIVSEENVTYHWTPSTGLDNDAIKNPTVTGDVTRDYTLTVTDSRGCTSDPSTVHVIIQPQIVITNTFTPNGDGVNDVWDLQGLIAYPNAVVDIFNRNGQKVYHSIGYTKPWDGTYNNSLLPFGTYYYIIDPKMYNLKYTGYVTLVK